MSKLELTLLSLSLSLFSIQSPRRFLSFFFLTPILSPNPMAAFLSLF